MKFGQCPKMGNYALFRFKQHIFLKILVAMGAVFSQFIYTHLKKGLQESKVVLPLWC